MKKILLVITISVFGIVSLNGCSTIEGVGKDLQGAGKNLAKEAKRAKNSNAPAPTLKSQDSN